jgi:putative sterol carrier protein
MSEVIEAAVAALRGKLSGSFDGVAKFVIPGEGTILLDAEGVRAGDGEADVTLTAEAEVFRAILEGRLNATSAYMTGRLSVEGDLGLAMRLGSVLG